MSNKETLQNYNTRMNINNNKLSGILEAINNLPEPEPYVQDKTVDITENGTIIVTPDSDYDGLSSITVNTSVIEDLTKELTAQNEIITEQEDQLQDIVEFLESKVEGEEGKGIRIIKNDANGYVEEIEVYGFETIPNYYLRQYDGSETYKVFGKLKKLILKEGLKNTGNYTFQDLCGGIGNCECILPDSLEVIGTCAFKSTSINITKLPPNLKTIGQQAFDYTNSTFKKIPDGVTELKRNTFSQSYNITQLSMKGITKLDAVSNGLTPFHSMDNLKAVWIGPNITNAGLPQYTFTISNQLSVPKIFIDLPRATVESFTYYYCGFCYSTDNEAAKNRIICNDDENWLTQDEFDAIDWSTYIEEA